MKITNPNHIYPLLISVNVFLSSYLIFKKAVKKFGKLDVLVANAGICIVNPAVETTPDDIDKIFSINFKGTFLADIAAAKQMKKQDTLGKIINCSSIAGHSGFGYLAAYSGTKFAIRGLTQALAAELAPKITVNAYCPGIVDTDMWKEIDESLAPYLGVEKGQAFTQYSKQILMGRPQKPEDVADLVSFLASPNSDYITGQAFISDGGIVMN
ncbi:SDR family oxidoreductase [Clostridium tyrobutyricum]|nr:SDR family oxidoreductase [Clostridium tyrobutyricum]